MSVQFAVLSRTCYLLLYEEPLLPDEVVPELLLLLPLLKLLLRCWELLLLLYELLLPVFLLYVAVALFFWVWDCPLFTELFVLPFVPCLGATLLYCWLLLPCCIVWFCGLSFLLLPCTVASGLRVPLFIWVTLEGLRVTLPV